MSFPSPIPFLLSSPIPNARSERNGPIESIESIVRRFATRLRLESLAIVAVLVAVGVPAQATPVDVFFDGAKPASDPTNSYGISAASAINARDNFGVPILDQISLMSGISTKLSVTLPPSSSLIVNPNPPTSTFNRIQSDWTISNISGSALTGASYLLFTHTTSYLVGSTTIDYPDDKVGLQIDKDLGWVVIKTTASGVDYYYPALLLDRTAQTAIAGNITAGATVSASINYVVKQALTRVGSDYRVPKLNLGFAQVVIPEPGSALLLGLGLTVLAASRKRA